MREEARRVVVCRIKQWRRTSEAGEGIDTYPAANSRSRSLTYVLDDGGEVGRVEISARAVERRIARCHTPEGDGGGGEGLEVVQGGDGAPREIGEGEGGSLVLEKGEDFLVVEGFHGATQFGAPVEDLDSEGGYGGWEGDVGEGDAFGEGVFVDLDDFRVRKVDDLHALAPGASGTSREAGTGVSIGVFDLLRSRSFLGDGSRRPMLLRMLQPQGGDDPFLGDGTRRRFVALALLTWRRRACRFP